jgi:Ca2+-transporting ATPase
VFAALLCRDQTHTVFDRDAFPGVLQLRRYALSILAIVLITSLDFLERIFNTTGLTFAQWCICIGIATSLVVVEELIKLVLRLRKPSVATPAVLATA